jgi:hypothetical protein
LAGTAPSSRPRSWRVIEAEIGQSGDLGVQHGMLIQWHRRKLASS